MGLERNMITSGEWQGIKLSGFDMDNSPAEAGRFPLKDRDVALCTSNGTRVIDKAKNCVHLFIASLLNARSCARVALMTAQASSCGITVVCAGQYGKFVLDDAYCAGYLLQELETNAGSMGIELKYSDASKAARALLSAYPDARTAFMESASGKVMIKTKSYEDFEVCLKTDCSEVVPYLQMENDLIWFGKWEETNIKGGKSMTKKQIIVAGILDTKGDEIKFLAQRVKAAGADAIILELSVGHEVGWADISVSNVVSKVGKKKEDIFALDRKGASDLIAEGAIKLVGEMVSEGKLDGIVAYGGSMGASIATRIMQTLPIGFPKIMLTTMASGDVAPYVGTSDICMLYPIAEAGLNKVTRGILNNAAGAVVGMVSAPVMEGIEEKPLIGCMMFGVTTPCVLHASSVMEKAGYDLIINHAVGSGGRSMEELIRDGYITGMLDITTHEIADEMLGGVLSAGPDRMTAAGELGIPQVIAPGGLDLINFGPKNTVPERLLKETDQPGRALYEHNPTVTCVGVSMDEVYRIGEHMAEKLNAAQGPSVLCIPMQGWGACDLAEPDIELGWAGPGAGPVWIADEDNPKWSRRSVQYVKALKAKIDPRKENVEVILVDKHMNDPVFAEFMAELLLDMLKGQWTKGSRSDRPYVIPF